MPIWSVLIRWRDLTNTQQDKKLPSICFSHVAHFMFFSLFLERLNCNHSQKIGRMNCSHNTIWNDMVFHAATCGADKKLINCWMSALNAKVSAIAGKEVQIAEDHSKLITFCWAWAKWRHTELSQIFANWVHPEPLGNQINHWHSRYLAIAPTFFSVKGIQKCGSESKPERNHHQRDINNGHPRHMHTTIDVYVYVFSVNIYVQKGKTIMIDGHWTLDTVTLIPLGTTIVPARDPKQCGGVGG